LHRHLWFSRRDFLSVTALVGLPGSGKSTVGRSVARSLDLPFIDTDLEIERREGRSIRAIFEADGEQGFRDLEASTLVEIMNTAGDAVLATGGGIVLREENRVRLSTGASVFYLRSRPQALFRRVRHDQRRPLLQVEDPLQKLRELFVQRDAFYRETAHYVIECDRPSISMLANRILMQIELARLAPANGSHPAALGMGEGG
jgi:shikimate kinase